MTRKGLAPHGSATTRACGPAVGFVEALDAAITVDDEGSSAPERPVTARCRPGAFSMGPLCPSSTAEQETRLIRPIPTESQAKRICVTCLLMGMAICTPSP